VLCLFQTEPKQPWRIHLRRDDLVFEMVDERMKTLRVKEEAQLSMRMQQYLTKCDARRCSIREMVMFMQHEDETTIDKTFPEHHRKPVRSIRLTLIALDHPELFRAVFQRKKKHNCCFGKPKGLRDTNAVRMDLISLLSSEIKTINPELR